MATIFTATNADNGREIWVTNGKPGGTHLLRDINPAGDSVGVFFEGFAQTANGAVFIADDGVHGPELWVTDGTTIGTHLVKDAIPGAMGGGGGHFLTFGDRVLYTGSDEVHGAELWVTDGTTGGTQMLADNFPGGPLNSGGFSNGCVAGGQVFFQALSDKGYELWATDGTSAGTRLVKDIFVGSNASGPLGSSPEGMTAIGSKVVFSAESAGGGNEVWVSDGSAAGTFMLKDINPGGTTSAASGFIAAGNQVFFGAVQSGFDNLQLWVTNGTKAGTHLVKDISGGAATSDLPGLHAAVLGSSIVFAANDGVHGVELWVSNGSAGGTTMLQDLTPGASGTSLGNFIAVGGKVFFSVNTPDGNDLWVTDGTGAGTHLVKEIAQGGGVDPRPFGTLGNDLLFAAETFDPVTLEHGVELWISDGTAAGTHLLQDVNPGAPGSHPDAFHDLGPLPGHAPTAIGLSSATIAENSANGAQVGLLSATDADAGDRFTFQLLDNPGGAFQIIGNTLVVADGLALDFEQSALTSLRIQVTDAALHTFETTLTVTISDVTPEVVTGDARANVLTGGIGDDQFDGGAGNDLLQGGAGKDVLIGGAGDDTLNGGSGVDRMTGGDGADTYRVDSASDKVVETNASTAFSEQDTVISTISYTLGANVEQVFLSGKANLNGTGNGLGNGLLGNDGNNLLKGLAGDDFLDGGKGNDTLIGGTGADAFVFRSALSTTHNRDVIMDFDSSNEHIYLDSKVFSAAGTALSTLAADAFWASASGLAHDASDRVLYNTTSGVLSYDADGSGAGVAVEFAVLMGHPIGLAAGSFLIL